MAAVVLLIVIAVVANKGPISRYSDARDRLEAKQSEVAALEQRQAELQQQLAKLGQVGHLEGLARKELSYARPGEDLFIVGGAAGPDQGAGTAEVAADSDSGAVTNPAENDPAAQPGLFERMVGAIRGLFGGESGGE